MSASETDWRDTFRESVVAALAALEVGNSDGAEEVLELTIRVLDGQVAIEACDERKRAIEWKMFVIEHPELAEVRDPQDGPEKIDRDEVMAALEAAVNQSSCGAVTTQYVGEVLWPEIPTNHGPEKGWRATRAQLRLAQVLAKLFREGKVDRLREHRGCNWWTIPGHPVHEPAFKGFTRESGGGNA